MPLQLPQKGDLGKFLIVERKRKEFEPSVHGAHPEPKN